MQQTFQLFAKLNLFLILLIIVSLCITLDCRNFKLIRNGFFKRFISSLVSNVTFVNRKQLHGTSSSPVYNLCVNGFCNHLRYLMRREEVVTFSRFWPYWFSSIYRNVTRSFIAFIEGPFNEWNFRCTIFRFVVLLYPKIPSTSKVDRAVNAMHWFLEIKKKKEFPLVLFYPLPSRPFNRIFFAKKKCCNRILIMLLSDRFYIFCSDLNVQFSTSLSVYSFHES